MKKLKKYSEYTQYQLITTTRLLIDKLNDFLISLGLVLHKSEQKLEFIRLSDGIRFIVLTINYDNISGLRVQLYSHRVTNLEKYFPIYTNVRKFLLYVFNEFSYESREFTHAFDIFYFKLLDLENLVNELTKEDFELFDAANNYNL